MEVGCFVQSKQRTQTALRKHLEKYGDQFAKIVKIKGDQVTLQFWTKYITISKKVLDQDWVLAKEGSKGRY